jgi:hypothetical protein
VKLDFSGKKELNEFTKTPMHYENQFDVAAGSYTLKLAFTTGGKFGKLETPLVVDPWDGKKLGLSSVVLSTDLRPMGGALDAELLGGRTPLVAKGNVEVVPSVLRHLKKTEQGVLYVEVYEPLLTGPNPPQVMLQVRVLDRKTGQVSSDVGTFDVASAIRAGNPMVPVGMKLPVASLAPGSYRAELKAVDSAGNQTVLRSADFELEP